MKVRIEIKDHIRRWEWAGVVFIIVAGASLHFLFEWSGFSRPVAVIAAVNESTWEHFKIAFWPAIFWALVEYPVLRNKTMNFGIAKAAGLLTMPAVIAVIFYAYTGVTGQHILLADVVIFILAVISGQLVSMRIISAPPIESSWLRNLALSLILIMLAAYSALSYFPPRNFIFADPETGEFGILDDYDHDEH